MCLDLLHQKKGVRFHNLKTTIAAKYPALRIDLRPDVLKNALAKGMRHGYVIAVSITNMVPSVEFLYARHLTDVLCYGAVRPSVRPYVRPSVRPYVARPQSLWAGYSKNYLA